MKRIKLFEDYISEKREDVGKYNTVKKVIAKLGRRPSEQELAQFITDNYYDVTEVERGEDDPAANDKIADLVAFYKFDIDDWEIAWFDAQNESVVNEALAPGSKIEKNLNKALKANINIFGDNNETVKVLDTPVRIERSQYDKEMNGRSKNFEASIMYMYGSRTNEYNTAAVIGVISRTKGTAKVFLYSEETYSQFAKGASFKEYEGASVLKEFQNKTRDIVSHLSKFPADGSANESVVNEAVSRATKIYQIATPAPKAMLVEELEELFGDDYRHIVTEFDDDEGYESVLVFNLTKNDIKRIQNEIGDVLIWEYSIKKGKEISESVVNEDSKDRMIKQIERALKDGTSIFKLPMATQNYYNKNKSAFESVVTEVVDLVHVYDEDGKMFGTGELVKTKGKKSLIRWDGSREEWVDSKLVKVVESKESDALAKAIDKAMIKIDDSMGYEDFALAVGKILKEEYGSHLFGKFMEVLHKDLGI